MKKIIKFTDVLGNTFELRAVKDSFREAKEETCWEIESRKIIPELTQWDYYEPLVCKYYDSEEEAYKDLMRHLDEYKKKAKREDIEVKEIWV